MIYLSGCIHPLIRGQDDLGYMITPNMGNRVDLHGVWWAADTSCFSLTGARQFRLDRYLTFLEKRLYARDTCLFATAPDVVGDAQATLVKAIPVLPLLRDLGYQAALVAQDGLEDQDIPWDAFDCLFIGGTTEWKLSPCVQSIAAQAKARGKWVHMGRVNSRKRLRIAAAIGCDSVDGTYLKYGPNILYPRLRQWMDELRGDVG